jgi:hypothetical protein
MAMRVTITPLNKTFYDERCKAARECFKHVDIMPPFLVVYMCYSVMYRAFNGNVGILRYVTEQWVGSAWRDCRESLWWTWHLYVRCRSLSEIQEIIDRRLEELTGDDHREWPDVVVVEEETEGLL